MLKNYLKIAYRNIARHKVFSFINFTGLSIGLACFAIIAKFILFETSYDSFHNNKDNIYRLVTGNTAKIPDLWAPGVKQNFPEVKNFVRLQQAGRELVEYSDKKFYEEDGMFADSNFFSVLSFKLLIGDPNKALVAVNSIVVTESFAKKYFGSANPINKSLKLSDDNGNKFEYRITGLCKDSPPNSHFKFDYLKSNVSNKAPWVDNWTWQQFYSYIVVNNNTNIVELKDKIFKWLSTKLADAQMPESLDLQRITDIHLQSHLNRELIVSRDISTLYIFGGIGFLILFIAIINFINLTTAKSITRAKEVGVRKASGAYKFALIKQFLGESLLVSFIVFLFSILLIELILPVFNELFFSELEFSFTSDAGFIFALLIVALVTGLIGGAYPAFILSNLNPVKILRGELVWKGGINLRKSLMVLQFAISSFLIISTLVIYSQMKFVMGKNLGFNKDEIIYFQIRNDNMHNNLAGVKTELLSYPGIKNVAVSANLPGGSDYGVPYKAEGINDVERPPLRILVIDEDFLNTFDIKLVEGRNFSKKMVTDRYAYILNQAAAKSLEWENPLTKKLSMPVIDRDWAPVIGVISDFHFRSLHEKIGPLMMIMESPDWYSYISLKIDSKNIKQILANVEHVWKAYDEENPFQFSFMDETIDRLYQADIRDNQLIFYLSGFSIFIACLGLYGLFAFSAIRRTKEIGIRKILGASNSKIVLYLSKEYVILILLGSLLAWPFAYYFMQNWLTEFAYKIEINIWMFLAAFLAGVGAAIITVSFNAIKAATTDPVKSLRYE